MITKAELVKMSEEFIKILASEDGHYDLWKDSPYITISRTEDREISVMPHKNLDQVKKDIASNTDERSGWIIEEVWDLKKKLELTFKVTVNVEISEVNQ